jgi:tripartite-type tricarboxylate transporter receptor subunit TctC
MLMLALAVIGLRTGDAAAQDYPNRPIRLIVPFAAGGAVDALARVLAAKLGEGVGQTVVIENRPGAAGNIATDAVAKSPPDGYTILQTTNGFAITPSLYRALPFDPANDFAPVTQLVASNLILVASPKLPVKSLQDFIALAKAKPGGMNYGSSGIGNPLHLTMEMLKHATGIDIQPVPYRGDAQINAALIAGEVEAAVVPLATAVQLVEDGRLRALGVTGTRRAAVLPNVPTIAEGGVSGFASTSWQGWFMPGKTPREIVARIQRETVKVLALPDVLKALTAMAYEPVGSTPADFAAFVKVETAKFSRVVADAHIPKQD